MIRTDVILTPERLRAEVNWFQQQDAFAFDVETWGANRNVPTQNSVLWIGIASHGRTIVVPCGHPNGYNMLTKATRKKNRLTNKFDMIPATFDAPPEQMTPGKVFGILKPLFLAPEITKIAHNATFDLISVAKYLGELPAGPYSDTIVLQWLLNENTLKKGLKELVKGYYGVDYDQEHVGRQVEAHEFGKVAHYQYMDAKYTWFLYQKLRAQISAAGLDAIYELEMDVLGVLLDIGITGVPVDEAAMHKLVKVMEERLVEAEADIYRAAGKRFNINAPAQKAEILFSPRADGGQGLKAPKMTKGGKALERQGKDTTYAHYSTDAATLERFPNNAVVKAMLQYSEVAKLIDYPLAYLGVEGNKDKPRRIFDGRVYPDLIQYGTVTGRFSCRTPNLQNISRPGTELGRAIRSFFVAPPGERLIVADYGQIELVVLAHYLGRGNLFKGFLEGIDPHTMTAAGVLQKPPSDVTPQERQDFGKSINFAVVYGAGPDKVASMAGVGVTKAKEFLSIHQRTFPEIYKFKTDVVRAARSRKPVPYVTTLMGRRRRMPDLLHAAQGIRWKAERQTVNSLIQGSAADLIKYAMIRANETLLDGMKLILSVHDEIVVTCPDDMVKDGVTLIEDAMLGPVIQSLLKVKLSSEIKVVNKWSEAK